MIATEVFDITKNCLTNKVINFEILQNNLKHTFKINYEMLGVGHITPPPLVSKQDVFAV